MMDTVFLGMSGGVDSSVAALLLQRQGYQVSGVHLRLLSGEDAGGEMGSACCDLSDAENARAVASRLGIPFYVFDFSAVFRSTVIRDFVEGYRAGRTPNPCVVCNREVKFGALLDRVQVLGGQFLATGHYARVARSDSGRYLLLRGRDSQKDQSYFLYMLTQEQLSHTLFPLGELEKTEVRRLAAENGLVNADRRDSQDICFAPDGDYAAFIERMIGEPAPAGDFLDSQGRVLGRHKGLIRYTLGQHKGLGLPTETPLYVLKKDVLHNTAYLGPDSALWRDSLTAGDINWISIPVLAEPLRVSVKTRYSRNETEGVIVPLEGGTVEVRFDKPQRAPAPGQAVVFYDNEIVVGGGTILG